MCDPSIAGPMPQLLSPSGARDLENMSLSELLYWIHTEGVNRNGTTSLRTEVEGENTAQATLTKGARGDRSGSP
jgi:hypothetical protein